MLWLYLLNAAFLITHEIDAAYWQEWDLFGLPGGIQLFLALNLLIVLVVLYGQQALVRGRPAGTVMSWVLVAGGLSAAGIHSYFIFSGDLAFRLPMSVFLLAAAFAVSLLQGAALVDAWRRSR
ncbi:MAG: hypothetical protein AMJ66_02175 [Betaproteobacteria bacterium SG8_40]|nr:MAG: hypothetical protein AMJ66_02175 [Betaproteobacteria bacterium SG8_40]